MDVLKNFQELCRRFCIRLNGPIFGVKLNLHIYKTVKYFKTSSLSDIVAANMCIMKKTRGLYHVSERRYFNFSPGRIFGYCGYTYRAGCTLCQQNSGRYHLSDVMKPYVRILSPFSRTSFDGLGENFL
jgi:hypothetical protein